jgi:hypothetical protein
VLHRLNWVCLSNILQYPHGIIDPIEEIGALALKNNLPFHVDSCIGWRQQNAHWHVNCQEDLCCLGWRSSTPTCPNLIFQCLEWPPYRQISTNTVCIIHTIFDGNQGFVQRVPLCWFTKRLPSENTNFLCVPVGQADFSCLLQCKAQEQEV